jgi:hypothetical protein
MYRNMYIAIYDCCQELDLACFQVVGGVERTAPMDSRAMRQFAPVIRRGGLSAIADYRTGREAIESTL